VDELETVNNEGSSCKSNNQVVISFCEGSCSNSGGSQGPDLKKLAETGIVDMGPSASECKCCKGSVKSVVVDFTCADGSSYQQSLPIEANGCGCYGVTEDVPDMTEE